MFYTVLNSGKSYDGVRVMYGTCIFLLNPRGGETVLPWICNCYLYSTTLQKLRKETLQ